MFWQEYRDSGTLLLEAIQKWYNCPGKRLAVPYKHKYKHTLWPRTLLFLSVINGKLFLQKPYCKCGQNAHSYLPQTGNNQMWLHFVQRQWVHPYPGILLSKDKENITILTVHEGLIPERGRGFRRRCSSSISWLLWVQNSVCLTQS